MNKIIALRKTSMIKITYIQHPTKCGSIEIKKGKTAAKFLNSQSKQLGGTLILPASIDDPAHGIVMDIDFV